MGIRELRAKYGKNKKGREAVNAAIRAELIGGNEAIEALALLHVAHHKLAERGLPEADLAAIAADACAELREMLAAEIARRYDLTG